MAVVKLQHIGIICTSVTDVESDDGIGYGGGGDEPARAPEREGTGWGDYKW